MASPGSGSTEAAATRSDALVWCAFLVAFSPLALDLFGHLRLRPWASYGLLFAVILVLRARSEPTRAAPRRDGYVLLLVALVLQGMAVGAGFARWGRLALPLGVFGLARALGRPSPRVAALSFWAVPVPTFVAAIPSPVLEGLWLRASAAIVGLAVPVSVAGTAATTAGGSLVLAPVDGGIPLAALLSGLGWVAALGEWPGTWRALRRAALLGLAAFPLQALAVTIALALAAAGAPALAKGWLSFGVFLVVAVAGLVFLAGRPRRPRD